MRLPEAFVAAVCRELGEAEGRALCEALDGEPTVSVRLNPAKCAGALPAVVAAEGVRPVGWCAEGRYLPRRPQFTFDAEFHAGAYYVQEPSSQFVGRLLADVGLDGARVLDLCAAPGGKSTLYASLVGRDGLVVANEIDRRRAQVLADNIRRWGTGNVVVTTADAERMAEFESWYDVVAVDAPCSGEGMFRKDDAARGEWSEANVRLCASRQDAILRAAWRALRPGGTLLYSTCTFNRSEDEGSLERFLAWAGDEATESAEVPLDEAWGVVCGRVGVFRTFRFFPHRAEGEGFFAAVARKASDAGGRSRVPRLRREALGAVDKASAAELARWVAEPGAMRFGAVGDTFYGWYAAQYDAVRSLSGVLPVIYSGVAMGQLFKGRLKPDPALALFAGLRRDAVPATELGAEEALRFLRKQDLAAGPFAEGINLVTAHGRALGFVKRIGARVNNLYPNSLRILRQQPSGDADAEA